MALKTEQDGMNRSVSAVVQSNRLVSRRLHRRSALSAGVCMSETQRIVSVPSVVAALPDRTIREAGMLELLAAEMRIAELEKALAEAREAAETDPLTGALNRRGFEKACQREMARAGRNGSSVVLAHIDLDDLKKLNDMFGHLAGDRALKSFVDLLHASIRPTDVLSRFGGEEFVLLLPDTVLEDARAVVERFLKDLSGVPVLETGWRLTFSAGISVFQVDENFESALSRVDAATYQAKQSGKNRVVAD